MTTLERKMNKPNKTYDEIMLEINEIRVRFWAADAALNKAKLTHDLALEKWRVLDKEYENAMEELHGLEGIPNKSTEQQFRNTYLPDFDPETGIPYGENT
jgi:hypothetical protein